jgi:fructose-1,6-bisphosphatase/inositol monophosphatase family enzyme
MLISDKELKKFVENILAQSAKIAKKYYRKSPNTKIKSDKSLVTIADIEIEKFLRKKILSKFKDHNILGEEQGGKLASNKYNWVIDPIDGTSSFKAGRPIFTTLLAIYQGYKPILGAIYQPINNELLIGMDGKLYFNHKIYTKKPKKNKITLATTSPDLFDKKGISYFNKLQNEHKNIIYGGDAYNYMLFALGNIDTIFEQGLKPHDFLPLIPILQASNAKFTDLHGNAINAEYNGKDFLVIL